MKHYLISSEHIAQVAEDLFCDNLIDHHTYTVFDEVVIGDAPVVQWLPITDQPIPKPANERQVLVLKHKTGVVLSPIPSNAKAAGWMCFSPSDLIGKTHYCIIETPLPPTV